jgi:hypothetical protein
MFRSTYQSHITPPITYKQVAEKFLEVYYNTFDTNFSTLHNFYTPNACITFADEEFVRFSDLLNKVVYDYKIYAFHHQNITYNAQPIGDKLLLITVVGDLHVNAFDGGRFTETILLTKDDINRYYIANSIFKVI